MIGIEDWLRYLLALIAVLAMILLAARVLRSFNDGGLTAPSRRFRRLGVEEFLPLDGRRRLVLLRHDEREYLVLLGQQSETLLNVADRPPAAPTGSAGPAPASAGWRGLPGLAVLSQRLRGQAPTARVQEPPSSGRDQAAAGMDRPASPSRGPGEPPRGPRQ